MKPFDYMSPATLDEAMGAWAETGRDARLLAGGTDLNVALRHGHVETDIVIDLKRVEELRAPITAVDGLLHIPATATMTQIAAFLREQGLFPSLQEAAAVVGSIQIRHRATLVGNICNGSPAADTVPVLAALGAHVEIAGPSGRRTRNVAEFIEGNRKIDLARGEVVTAVVISLGDAPLGCAFDRITRRRGVDLATTNLCCTVGDDGQTVLAYGAVTPRPLVVRDRSGILADPTATPQDRRPVLMAMAAEASPITDVRASAEYRSAMLTVMAERALGVACARLVEARRNG